jgi:hypothetical protein
MNHSRDIGYLAFLNEGLLFYSTSVKVWLPVASLQAMGRTMYRHRFEDAEFPFPGDRFALRCMAIESFYTSKYASSVFEEVSDGNTSKWLAINFGGLDDRLAGFIEPYCRKHKIMMLQPDLYIRIEAQQELTGC